MDTYNSILDKPGHVPNREVEAKDSALEDRLVEFIQSLPPQMQAYIRAALMEQETGEMPMPPGMGLPGFSPPGMGGPPMPSFSPPLP